MTRREQREQVFLMLFRVEFHNPADLPEQVALFEELDKPVCSEKENDCTSGGIGNADRNGRAAGFRRGSYRYIGRYHDMDS